MEIVIIVIALLVLGIGGYFMFGRGDKALPPPEEEKKLPEKQPKKAAEKAEKKPEKAPKKEEPPRAEEEEEEEEEEAEEAAAEEPTAEPTPEPAKAEEPAPDAPLKRPSKPSEEDVKALKKGLKSTRGGFIAKLAKLFGGKKEIDPALLDEIEEVLIGADIGVKTTDKILSQLRERLEKKQLGDTDRIWAAIKEEAEGILAGSHGSLDLSKSPTVILVVGVNGVGKTTTIGKLASRYTEEGKKVILAAGDTFRAAAVLQLEVWGRRTKCKVVKGKDRADPGSVIFDAIKAAKEDGADIVIADTAGRLHTKTPLMEELKKVHRTCEKALDGRSADEVLLVLDSTNGQNAIQQAQMFKDALPISGIVLTKLDGTAKGGVILGIVDEHQVPVRFIGIGERVEDLREFDAPSFVEALFEKPDDETLAA
jgi:fused signal recognition particle receptor